MALDINQLRAAFSKKSETTGEGNAGFWNLFYPFYKMNFDDTVVFRFLPDLDDNNPLGFIVENKYHELIINGQKKRIACLKMFGEACGCCEHSQKYYNDGDTAMGKSFWRKIDYIAQGVIVATPFEYPIKPEENHVRMVSLGPKLYKVIESSIVKGDMDNMPYDMLEGYNFNIAKTKQGEYADYSTSHFARKATPIAEEVLAKVELYDLKNYRYGKIERDQMDTMIEAFMTGKTYEAEKGPDATAAKETRPAGEVLSQAAAATAAPAQPSTTTAAVSSGAKLTPQEILKKLKERQQANATS